MSRQITESIHKPLKKVWRRRGTPSVAYARIQEGSLFVNTRTLEIKSVFRPNPYSLPRSVIITPREEWDGYLNVHLRYRYRVRCGRGYRWIKRREKTGVHRVVWIAFNGRDIPHGLEVHHLDHDPKNNHPSNLCLHTELAQRQRRDDLFPWEEEAIAAYMDEDF